MTRVEVAAEGLLPTYFGCLGLWYILLFVCMVLLYWRKRIHEKRRAKAWIKQQKAETYFQRALDHPAKKVQPETEARVYTPACDSIPKPQSNSLSNETTTNSSGNFTPSFLDPDPYKPVFLEIPCACVLSHLPPLLEHSASYPCSSIPPRSAQLTSPLKSAMLKNEPFNTGSSASA
ncbi:hypothetical protein JRQ81_014945 [Phrynocephalus forsythii]|uniref:Testis expressed 38 n=1 Tax=Phrynocephalus forsythii TaxID=171643 RepID=A0A9Q0XYN3_9SAUR|nr:hypothetical protein JRQ81_014945 [Phrynocephalus forsythii]